MEVDLLLAQLAQVFPNHCRHALRNCINERLLQLGEDADGETVLDTCINWLLDQSAANQTDGDVMPAAVHLDVIDLEEERHRVRDRLRRVRDKLEFAVVVEDRPPSVETLEPPTQTTDEIVDEVLALFSDAQPAFVRQLVEMQTADQANRVCNYLLEHRDYPKVETTSKKKPQPALKSEKRDYFKDFSTPVSYEIRDQALSLLYNDFKMIAKQDILQVAAFHNYHYAATRKYISDILAAGGVMAYTADSVLKSPSAKEMLPTSVFSASTPPNSRGIISAVATAPDHSPVKLHIQLRRLTRQRRQNRLPAKLHPDLEKEVKYYEDFVKKKVEERESLLARTRAERESRQLGNMFECGCCFGEVIFEDLVQCSEGHLFCCECLRMYAKEAAFGQGKASLSCMGDGCQAQFLHDQLQKALPSDLLTKYDERLREESLSLAKMPGLIRCPGCYYAALMDPDDKVFRCQNSECLKETCRYCKEEWSDHFGKPCHEVEKQSDVAFRLSIEEQMTEAKIRQCPNCRTQFYKEEGCNKMTCRCHSTMCYICRQYKIDYEHFCQHVREPGKGCTKCKKCSLWTNQQQDDDMAIAEIRKKALSHHKAAMKKEFREFSIKIGPVVGEPPKKKGRRR